MKSISASKHKDKILVFFNKTVQVESTFIFGFHRTLDGNSLVIESFYN